MFMFQNANIRDLVHVVPNFYKPYHQKCPSFIFVGLCSALI